MTPTPEIKLCKIEQNIIIKRRCGMILKVNINDTKELDQRIKFIENVRDVVSVEKYEEIPEVPVVETGILMSPMEICNCNNVVAIDFRNNDGGQCYLSKSNQSVGIGKRLTISEHVFPREFYRDIQKTFDFSAIPVGAVIEVERDNQRFYGDFKYCKDGVFSFGICSWNDKNIKSIRIVEMPRGEK